MKIHAKSRCTPILIMIGLACFPTSSSARTAAQLFQRAVERFSSADFEGSVRLLEQARHETTEPTLLGRIQLYLGANHSTLGKRGAAREAFRRALIHDPALSISPKRFKAATVALFRAVRATMHGALLVTASREGLVDVDRKTMGNTPLRIQLPIGRHRVVVRGPDGAVWHRGEVVIRHDTTSPVHAAPVRAAEPDLTPVYRPRAAGSDRAPQGRVWTWVAAGGAVVSLGAAIGLVVAGHADNEEYWDEATDRQTGARLEDSGRAKQRAGQVLFGVAGALAVTSVVLYLLEGRSTGSERRSSSATLFPLAGRAAGLGLWARF
jgi:hypothetical protein